MNFKKYHVSRNLFDPNSTRYHMGKGSNNQIAPFGNGAMFYIEAESNMTYTIKVHTTDSTFVRLYLSNAPIVENVVKSYNVISESETIMNPEVTISNTDYAYLWIQIGGAWYTEHGGSSIMLNTGSQPLPYESYDTEVWHDVPYYIHNTSTDTLTTLPADIYANATTATVGLKGQTVKSGTPTPDSPVMPQGTGERTGNLYNINAKDVNNGYVNNAQLNQDGTTETWGRAEISEYIPISGDTAYTFNGIGSYNSPCYGLYDENKQLIGAYRYNGAQIIKFTSPNNARYFRFTHIKAVSQAMMVEGAYTTSTMPDYEPYGYKISISSANTTTPVYLGEVETTRKIKKLVLDGTENFTLASTDTNRTVCQLPLRNCKGNYGFCTHILWKSPYKSSEYNRLVWTTTSGGTLFISLSNEYLESQTVADFKTYLQQQYANGTPVTIWYVLATPTTGVVNEPLMRIGDYADTLSGITIPVTAGGDTLSIGTTVQPSEVTVNYKGWHPVQSVHEFTGNYTVGTMQTLPISELETHTISDLQGGEWS